MMLRHERRLSFAWGILRSMRWDQRANAGSAWFQVDREPIHEPPECKQVRMVTWEEYAPTAIMVRVSVCLDHVPLRSRLTCRISWQGPCPHPSRDPSLQSLVVPPNQREGTPRRR